MRTTGGLLAKHVDRRHGLIHITFSGYHEGAKQHTLTYHPLQKFDMAPEGQEVRPNMAQRVNVVNVSDLSGEEGDGVATVTFGLDGVAYEIDLTEKEQAKFRDALAKYVGAARPVKGRRKRGTAAAATKTGPSARKVREWATENGYDVPARGRIPAEVQEAYNAANPAA